MEKLKALVHKLESENDKNRQIEILQSIGKSLICDYVIEFLGITIEPLWVEAYYYSKEAFPDCNTHLSEKQRNRFGQLYFHKTGRGGFDICVSDKDDYYLSFLLKAFLANGDYKTQTGIKSVLNKAGKSKDECESVENVLKARGKSKNETIMFTERVGLAKTCYADAKLAIFPLNAVSEHKLYSFAKQSLSKSAYQYMQNYIASHDHCSKSEYENECRRVFGWEPDIVWKLIEEHTK